jgi:hypothetical protein
MIPQEKLRNYIVSSRTYAYHTSFIYRAISLT